jgi:putative serine protease PepD
MRLSRLFLIALLVLGSRFARAEEQAIPASSPDWEAAAKKLQQATVTVRIWSSDPETVSGTPLRPAAEDDTASEKPASAVTVCSGVCVREGRIITAALAGSDTRIRLTLSGGAQADAKVQVIDEYSGLALLKTEHKSLTPIAAAAELPAVGGSVLTAAAWGLEQPLVSQGIVGGVDRQRPGVSFPPLLQCDLRTLETSSGAGIVDRAGKLLGIVVAVDDPASRRGWAYAVPASHVERILRAADGQQKDGVLVLKRRRPIVGMVLDQDGDAIVVQRLTAGGPAEKAGLKPGDQILTTDGVAIRSVYQAVLPTLYKQPGDTTTFRVEREGALYDLKVTLGGGVELSSAPIDFLAGIIQPKVEIARDPAGGLIAKSPRAEVREVAAPPLPDDEPPAALAPTSAEKIALLEKALDRYRAVIEIQQKQLQSEQQRQAEQEQQIKTLQAEMETLKKALLDRPGK